MDDVLALHQQKNDLLHQHGYLVRSIWKYEWLRRRTADPAIRTFLKMHQTPRPLDPRDVFFGRRNKRLLTQPERGRRRTYPLLRFQEPVPLREQILPLSRRLSPDHLPTASRPRPRRVFRLCLLYRFTAHRSVASRLAVPMQSETHVPLVCHLRPPVHRRPTTRQARRRLPSHRRSTRSHHHANIRKNPGQRALAKLMLNSMWGKFGQQTNKTQVKEFIDPPDFWQFLDSSAHDVRWVSPVTEEFFLLQKNASYTAIF